MTRACMQLPTGPWELDEWRRTVEMRMPAVLDLHHWSDRWQSVMDSGMQLHVRKDIRTEMKKPLGAAKAGGADNDRLRP